MSKKIVIIGGVAAGPKAACRLKRLQPEWDITVIDQDSLISYGGCGIPYYVCGDVSDEKELRSTSFHMVRDEHFFATAKGVTVRTRTRAMRIDRQEKTVYVKNLDSGEESRIPYDRLLLATGAQPVDLPIPGVDLDGVFSIANLHRAIEIKERIAKGKVSRAVVVGGGAIGIEMAEAFTDLWGVETTLVEYMDQLLPKIVDLEFAAMLETHLKEKDVQVLTGESATEIIGNADGRVTAVKTGHREIPADMVIMAVGVRPRSNLARDAGLMVTPWGGIKVNHRLQTSDPDIYAAGDCIATVNLVTGKEKVKVQDAYSMRSTPQVIGAARDQMRWTRSQVEIEANGVGDNPIFLPEDDVVLTGANFQGTPVSLPVDTLGAAVTMVCVLSERRLNRLTNPALSVGLPPFLTKGAGMFSGLMLCQYTADMQIVEQKILSAPAYIQSIPAAADQEDFVSMGMNSSLKTRQILDTACGVLGIELMAAAQALDLRDYTPGHGTRAAHAAVREHVEYLDVDRPLYRDHNAMRDAVKALDVLRAVESEVGELATY